MILTDGFVYIHQPKTGGTFVTEVLTRIHQTRAGRALVPFLQDRRLRKSGFVNTKESGSKHGTCDDIPPSHRGKPIVACIRNPYDRYVSQYNFRWWARHKSVDAAAQRKRFPNFPDFTFAEYLEFAQRNLPVTNLHFPAGRELGQQTCHFVKYFFRDGAGVLPTMDEAYLAARAWEKDLHPVQFLHTDRLNQELHDFLQRMGYAPAEIAFIRSEGKIYPQHKDRRQGKTWESHYTPELKQLVRTRERLLFLLFPEFDV